MGRNDYTLDGVPLNDPQGRWFTERSTGVKKYPARRSTNLQYPRWDGTRFHPGSSFEPGYVLIRLYIEGSTHQKFIENYEFILGIIGQRHKRLELVHHLSTTESRVALVEFPDSTEIEMDGPLRGFLDLNAQVTEAFWKSPDSIDFSLPVLTTSKQTVNMTSLNGGNAPVVQLSFRVKGSFGTVRIEDPVSGSVLIINGPLGTSEYIIANTNLWTARKVTTNTWDNGEVVDNVLVPNRGSGRMFEIAPQRIGSSLGYQLIVSATNPSGSPVLQVRAKKSYL